MSFQTSPAQDLINLINAKNGTSFVLTDMSFSNPQQVSGTWQQQVTTKNTAVRATGNGTTFQGRQIVLYDRLDLGVLSKLDGFSIKVTGAQTVWDLLNSLTYYTGIQFGQTDLLNSAVTTNPDGTGTATLTADPNSLGWIGTVQIPFSLGGVDFNAAITQPNMSGINYPVADASGSPGTITQAPLYLYGYDFTPYVAQLINLVPGALGSTDMANLITALKATDVGAGATLWNSTAATAWSLAGANIVSNGLNSSSLPTNPNYKYVLAIDLAANVPTPTGRMYLHYNDPFNPNAF